MKSKLYFLLILLSVTGCGKIDNYDAPQLTLSGKILDSQTNQSLENGGVNAGTVIKTLEGDSKQPYLINSFPDGHFVNGNTFPGSYKIWAEGAFTMTEDTLTLEMTKDTEIEIKVIPYVRLKATFIDVSGSTAMVKIEYEKLNSSLSLTQLGLSWSTFPNPNATVYPGGSIILENASVLNSGSGEKIYTITNLKPGTRYYIRGIAKTNNPGSYFNYSTPFTLQTL